MANEPFWERMVGGHFVLPPRSHKPKLFSKVQRMRARPPQALERALPGAVDQAEPFELRGATPLLQVENRGAMAEALAAFFSRHPLG